MSDRPMRLKLLTKMKIILCIFLLYITAVSVFGKPQELNGILGKSIEFPATVKIEGSWMYSGVTIGVVISGRFRTPDKKYEDRLHWNSSTGLFSLSELKEDDSGVYTVQDTHQNINTIFQLNLYKDNVPVLKPHVSVTHDEYPCTLLCTVERGTGVTLTLYKNGEKNPYVTLPVRNHPDLDMTVTVESGTYTCEAKNSVSRQTSDPLTVEAHCTAPSGLSAGTIAAIIIVVLIVALIAVVLAVLYRRIRSKHAGIRREHAVTGSELEDTKSELKDTKSELEGIRKEHAITGSELEDTKSELKDTKSELEVTKGKLEGIRKEHANTKSELKVTKGELEGIRKEHAITKGELEGIRKEHAITKGELEGIRKEHAITKGELEGIRKEHAITKGELEGIRKEHASIRKEHAITKGELEGIRKEHANTKSELKAVGSLNQAVGSLNQVTGFLEKMDPSAFPLRSLNQAVRSLNQVKGILEKVDPSAFRT